MKKYTAIAAILLAISWSCAGAAVISITTGTSIAVSVWQTTPEIFSDSTKWGGIGLDLGFGRVSFGASITITDFETLSITSDPSVSLSVALMLVKRGSLSLSVSGGTMLTLDDGFQTISFGTSISYSPFENASVYVSLGAQSTLPTYSRQGTTLNLGAGISYSIPIF